MSEASGLILIKTKKELYKKFSERDMQPGSYFLEPLLTEACLHESDYDADDLELEVEDIFLNQGIEVKNGWMMLKAFGYEWMPVMKLLAKKGKNIELYGRIEHPDGFTEYYAHNHEGNSYFAVVDPEGGDDEEHEQSVIDAWLACVPAVVRTEFPQAFPV